jgi:hypothetical protein
MCQPRELGAPEAVRFLTMLAHARRVSASTHESPLDLLARQRMAALPNGDARTARA